MPRSRVVALFAVAGWLAAVAMLRERGVVQSAPPPSGFDKLHEMACKIRLGMPQQEVERVLGKPTYSPTEGQYYYDSGAKDEQGVPFGLIVYYNRSAYREGEQEKFTGRLEEFSVGRIGE